MRRLIVFAIDADLESLGNICRGTIVCFVLAHLNVSTVAIMEYEACDVHESCSKFGFHAAGGRVPFSISGRILTVYTWFKRFMTMPEVHHLCPTFRGEILPLPDGVRSDDSALTLPTIHTGAGAEGWCRPRSLFT